MFKNDKRLENINKQSRADQPSVVDWYKSANYKKFWFPENLTHLFHCPVYERMSLEDKLIYNQYFARLVVEQTIFLEDHFLNVVFSEIEKRDFGFEPEFLFALNKFIEEEREHTAMFWRLLEQSDSEMYKKGAKKFKCFKNSFSNKLLLKLCSLMPQKFLSWIWLTYYAEEKFILIYKEAKKNKEVFDQLHYQVHHQHMLDESRHVQVDELLLEYFWDPASNFLKKVNVFMLKKFFKDTVVNSCHSIHLWKVMLEKHPHMSKYSDEAIVQLKNLDKYTSYKEKVTSKESMPSLHRNFNKREELEPVSNDLSKSRPILENSYLAGKTI